MNDSKFTPEHGAAMFIALISLTVIGYVSLKLASIVTSYSTLTRTYDDGLLHHTAMRSQVQIPLSQFRSCEIQRLKGTQISGRNLGLQNWQICVLGRQPWISNHLTFKSLSATDFNTIFNNPTPCSFLRKTISSTTFTTPKAQYTCELPQQIYESLVTTDNIWADNAAAIALNPAKTLTLATPGEIIVESALTLSSPTLIIAGGDIKINSLNYSGTETIDVTILSAHGAITISRVSNSVRPLILSRIAVSSPPAAIPANPPLPPFRVASISGMISE